jgi:predicted dehydrogenase
MGKSHALGFGAAGRMFDLPFNIDLAVLADATATLAARGARALGFRRSTANWRDLLVDSETDIIDITAPNTLLHEIALAAIAAGKHVYCKKPLAPTPRKWLMRSRMPG